MKQQHFGSGGKRAGGACLARRALAFMVMLALIASIARAESPTTLPATPPTGIDPALWARMVQIDAKAGRIADLTADFEQKKFTPLLKKPMISTGTVLAKGSAMLWDTRSPEPTIMRVDESQLRIYYPKQKTLEAYPIAGQLSALASSPLPRLAVLLPHFTFAVAAGKDLTDVGEFNAQTTLALRLAPVDESLKEHLDHVVVLIDSERGFILGFKMVDSDQEATVIRFSNTKVSTGIEDSRLRLDVPPGVKIVRPLENLGGGSGANGGQQPKRKP
jgi:outer membrane lipoprotein-sorting protein